MNEKQVIPISFGIHMCIGGGVIITYLLPFLFLPSGT